MTEEDELKPCPHCGEIEVLSCDEVDTPFPQAAFAVYCGNCGMSGPHGYSGKSKEEAERKAEEAWNALPRHGMDDREYYAKLARAQATDLRDGAEDYGDPEETYADLRAAKELCKLARAIESGVEQEED